MNESNVSRSAPRSKAKSQKPWYKWVPSDFLQGIVGMNAGEIGCYVVLLNMMYDQERPIREEIDSLAYRIKTKPGLALKYVDELVRRGKIIRHEGFLYNEKAIDVLNDRLRVRGAEEIVFPPEDMAKWVEENDAPRNFSEENEKKRILEEKNSNDSNGDSAQIREDKIPPISPQGGSLSAAAREQEDKKLFNERFWPVYPKQERGGRDFPAFRVALRAAGIEALVEGARIYAEIVKGDGREQKFVKNASTWLNAEGWKVKSGPSKPRSNPIAKKWEG